MRSLLKTLYLLTSVRVNVYVFNNDDKAFFNILAGVREWHVETESRLIFHNVKEAITDISKFSFSYCVFNCKE